jgi:hypothetical protein
MGSSNSKFRTILRRSSDRPNYQELLTSLGVRLSEPSNFEFGIAAGLPVGTILGRCGQDNTADDEGKYLAALARKKSSLIQLLAVADSNISALKEA